MLKNLIVAAVVASLPVAASAMTITGQIDISGMVNLDNSAFNAAGNADIVDEQGVVIGATGDFGAFAGFLDIAVVNDVDFSAPGAIWSVGGFTFTATSFSDFEDDQTAVGFTALGLITGNGFDATDGRLSFSANPLNGLSEVSFSSTTTAVPIPAGILLLGTALAGFGMVGRKRA